MPDIDAQAREAQGAVKRYIDAHTKSARMAITVELADYVPALARAVLERGEVLRAARAFAAAHTQCNCEGSDDDWEAALDRLDDCALALVAAVKELEAHNDAQ